MLPSIDVLFVHMIFFCLVGLVGAYMYEDSDGGLCAK